MLEPKLLDQESAIDFTHNCSYDAFMVFSAKCTIGMVWGFTALKSYGNKVFNILESEDSYEDLESIISKVRKYS